MINYIVQVVLFQILFLAVYDLFLQKETFFKWNRLYLLATPVLSFIIPLIKFETFQNAIQQDYIVWLPEVVLNPETIIVAQLSNPTVAFNYLNWVFYIGLTVFIVVFLLKLVKIIRLITSNKNIKKDSYSLVLLNDKKSAFSFFKYIFIDKEVLAKDDLQIIQHELVHCKQYHTADLIFFELFKVIMWFNPLIYIYQKRITVLHEYISDSEVVKESDKKTYFNNLLSETFNVENISFTNQFYKQSLIKKRIAMITKTQSHKLKQLKYLVLVPLLGGMLFYSSCESNESSIGQIEISKPRKEMLTIYHNSKDGGISANHTLDQETYFDLYTVFNDNEPKLSMNPIDYSSLSVEEREEFNKLKGFNESSNTSVLKTEIFQLEDGRKIILERFKFKRLEKPNRRLEKPNREDFIGKEDIPFAIVDESPSFDICSGSPEEVKSCFNKELQMHVARKFNADLAQNLDLEPGRKKIYVQFKILKDGSIEIVGARAPHADLEKEARRVIGLLPILKPGKFDGKSVNVMYMLPISFNVAGENDESAALLLNSENNNDIVSKLKSNSAKAEIDYFVNGKKASKKEIDKLSNLDIKSINVIKSKNDGRDKIEITLKD